MSQAGWYPDPEGGDEPRYWDGEEWLDAPPPRKPGRPGGSTIWWIVGGLGVIALVVVALLIGPGGVDVAGPRPDDRSDRPTIEPWDELTDSPTEEGSTDDGGAQPAECPSVGVPYSEVSPDGRLRAGGLSVEAPAADGWRLSSTFMPWMSEQNSMTREVVPGWVASVDIGTVEAEDGFTSPRQAARGIISCMASSWMFDTFTHSETTLTEEFTLDGHDGWYMQEEVYVSGREVPGDVLDVYVLDLGNDGQLSVIVGCATIGHEPSIEEVKAALETMRVD